MSEKSNRVDTSSAKKLTQADFYAIENERSRRDVSYFIDEYVRIEDRDVEGIVIPFKLWPRQIVVLAEFLRSRLVQVLKANQLGLTWLILAYATWKMIFNPGYLVLGISETELKAKELIRRIEFILRHLPDWMITDRANFEIPWYEPTTMSIVVHHPMRGAKVMPEDSSIQTFASSPTAGASFTANLFLFDEWALQQYAREIWTYAFPTINRPTGGQVIGISTVERGSLFEDIWKGDNDFVKIFLGWDSDPRRNPSWYNDTLRSLGRDETMKHYPASAAEAFTIPGGAFFSEVRSDIHVKPVVVVPDWYTRYRVMDYGLDMLACYWIYIDPQGFARVYREVYRSGLVISEAAYEVLKASGADVPSTVGNWDVLGEDEKQRIATTQKEKYACTYAPPDLFSKQSQTGRPSSDIWYENGIVLVQTKNDFEQGCLAMSEWLHPIVLKDEQTGLEYATAGLTIDEGAAPNLENSLLNIQKDKNNPKVYAKQPHGLTHPVDSIRYWATEYTYIPITPKKPEVYRTEREYVKAKIFDKIQKRSLSPQKVGQRL